MPCLLISDPNVKKESSHPKLLSDLFYSPLLIIPSTDFVPLGRFQALVVKLSQDESLRLDPDYAERFRNRICFYFHNDEEGGNLLHVEIRSMSSHLEVRILTDEPDTVNQRLIIKFRCKLWNLFKKVASLSPNTENVNWDFGFYCPCGLQLGIPPHLSRCHSKVNPREVVCNTQGCKKGQIRLEDKQNCWFMVSVIYVSTIVALKIKGTTGEIYRNLRNVRLDNLYVKKVCVKIFS